MPCRRKRENSLGTKVSDRLPRSSTRSSAGPETPPAARSRSPDAASALAAIFQRLDLPIIVTEHYPAGLGPTVPELRDIFDEWKPQEKITFSCAGDAGFNAALKATGRDQIVLCGIETHVCVYQTALDLLHRDLQVAVASDAISSCAKANTKLGLQRIRDIGAQVMGVEMILFEILREAKTDDFKAVVDLLKE